VRLAQLGSALLAGDASERPDDTRGVRRALKFTAWRGRFETDVCGDALGGTRLDNLVCDGFLPLLAARASGTDVEGRFHAWWYHWFAGDLPPLISRGLQELGVFAGSAHPACHGAAQGLLGWLLEREARH
jgi:hypothetical protein